MLKKLCLCIGILAMVISVSTFSGYLFLVKNRDAMYAFLDTSVLEKTLTNDSFIARHAMPWVYDQHMENGRAFFTRSHDLYRYDPYKAAESFRKAVKLKSSKEGLYNMARAAMVLPGYKNKTLAIKATNAYIETYPGDNQVYYIQGLAKAYARDLDGASSAFHRYIQSYPNSWHGHLDLSWVHFQKGEFEESKNILEKAIAIQANNPWLYGSYAAVLHALGKNNSAEIYADKAIDAGANLEKVYWRSQYFGNDPEDDNRQIRSFIAALRYNKDMVVGIDSQHSLYQKMAFDLKSGNISPLGKRVGIHMSACGSACPSYSQLWRANNGTVVRLENDANTDSCWNVQNAAGLGDMVVPTKSSSEWSSFYSNAPSGVSFGTHTACVGGHGCH